MQLRRPGQDDDARPTLWMLTAHPVSLSAAIVARLVPEVRVVAVDSVDSLFAAMAEQGRPCDIVAVQGLQWVAFHWCVTERRHPAIHRVGVFSVLGTAARVEYGISAAVPLLDRDHPYLVSIPLFVAALLGRNRRRHRAVVATLRGRGLEARRRGAPARAAAALAVRRQRERVRRMRVRTGARPLTLTSAQGAWLRPRVDQALDAAVDSGDRERAIALRRILRALQFDPVVLDGRLCPLVASLIVVSYGTSPLAANEIARALTQNGYPTSHWRGLVQPA